MEPICSIRLPSHHPAVKGCQPGQKITLVAEMLAEDRGPMMSDGPKPAGPKAPPLERSFHVVDISAAKGTAKAAPGAPAAPAKKNPMEYLKAKQTTEAAKGTKAK